LLLQAVLGKARAMEASQEQRAAWELLSEASIRLPWAVPVHMELARLTLAQQDWDSLLEVTAHLQQVDGSNIMALAYTGEPHRLSGGQGTRQALILLNICVLPVLSSRGAGRALLNITNYCGTCSWLLARVLTGQSLSHCPHQIQQLSAPQLHCHQTLHASTPAYLTCAASSDCLCSPACLARVWG
jgi:hypothetical protein